MNKKSYPQDHSNFEGKTFEPSGLVSMQRTKSGGVSLLLYSDQIREQHNQYETPPSEHGILLLFSGRQRQEIRYGIAQIDK